MNIIKEDQIHHLNHVINSLLYQGNENPLVAIDHLNEINRVTQESLNSFYEQYPDWFVELLKEFIDVNNKVHKLNDLIYKEQPESLMDNHREFLQQQLRIMEDYRYILERRIQDADFFKEYGF